MPDSQKPNDIPFNALLLSMQSVYSGSSLNPSGKMSFNLISNTSLNSKHAYLTRMYRWSAMSPVHEQDTVTPVHQRSSDVLQALAGHLRDSWTHLSGSFPRQRRQTTHRL